MKNNGSNENVGKFLLFSDVHLDPFYGSPNAWAHEEDAPCKTNEAPMFSTYGCESNYALVESTIKSASKAIPQPDFILFTGDATRHSAIASTSSGDGGDVAELVRESIGTIFDIVKEQFPHVPVVSLPPIDLGNNDFEDDYTLQITSTDPCIVSVEDDGTSIFPKPTNKWLEDIVASFDSTFKDDVEAATFACGGYLTREVANGLYIISLNTVLWSNRLNWQESKLKRERYHMDPSFDPLGQHKWLEHTLKTLRSQKKHAYITGHIPPIVMSYTQQVGNELMYRNHVHRFYDTVAKYEDVVSGLLFGHVHSNELRSTRSLGIPKTHPPMFISGSVSPCYRSEPFFHVITYDRGKSLEGEQTREGNKAILDIATYAADLKKFSKIKKDENNHSDILEFRPLFMSILEFFGMKNFTNAEVERLSGRFLSTFVDKNIDVNEFKDAKNDEQIIEADSANYTSKKEEHPWNKYWNHWYKGTNQIQCDGRCRLEEACITSCGLTSDEWESCIDEIDSRIQTKADYIENAACTLPLDINLTVWEENLAISSSSSVMEGGSLVLHAAVFTLIAVVLLTFLSWIWKLVLTAILKKQAGDKRQLVPIDDANEDQLEYGTEDNGVDASS